MPDILVFDSHRRRANARNVSFRTSLRWPIHIINSVDNQFRYIKIQHNTIDLSTRLWGINPTNSAVIPQSLVLRSIVFRLKWSIILVFDQPRSQCPSSSRPPGARGEGGGKMRDPGNKVLVPLCHATLRFRRALRCVTEGGVRTHTPGKAGSRKDQLFKKQQRLVSSTREDFLLLLL